MLIFDPDTGLRVSEVEDVRQDVRQAWIDAFSSIDAIQLNTDPSTPQGQIIDSQTASIVEKDTEILYLANQFNPLNAEGKYQDALAQIYFISRQPAISSSAVCTCTGRQGTVIQQGSIIESVTDGSQWRCVESVTIPQSGTVDATFECTQTGAISAASQTLTKIITVTAGWDSVFNAASAITGRDEENQGTFEARRYQSVALNSRSAPASVYGRVGQVQGVLSHYVIDNKSDEEKVIDGVTLKPHSVYVSVTGGEDYAVAKAIYDSVSAGCAFNGNTSIDVHDDITSAQTTVLFDRPETLPIYIKVTLRQSEDLPSDVYTIVREAVYNNFYGLSGEYQGGEPLLRVAQGDDLYSSRFYPSIVNKGVNYILNVELSDDPAEGEQPQEWEQFIHIPINMTPELPLANIAVDIVDQTATEEDTEQESNQT